jgi:hypothetical protein
MAGGIREIQRKHHHSDWELATPSLPKCLRWASHSAPRGAYGDEAHNNIAPGMVAMLGRSACRTS